MQRLARRSSQVGFQRVSEAAIGISIRNECGHQFVSITRFEHGFEHRAIHAPRIGVNECPRSLQRCTGHLASPLGRVIQLYLISVGIVEVHRAVIAVIQQPVLDVVLRQTLTHTTQPGLTSGHHERDVVQPRQ